MFGIVNVCFDKGELPNYMKISINYMMGPQMKRFTSINRNCT